MKNYQLYKDSAVEWLGDVPEHWEVKPLKQYSHMIGGFAFSSEDFCEDGIQLLKISNVYNNDLRLDRQPTYLPNHFLKSHSLFRVTSGDIILSLTGTLGKRDYGYAVLIKKEKDFLLNQRLAKFVPSNKIYKGFLIQLLHSNFFLDHLFAIPSGTKQANLSNSEILRINVAIPPLDEQKSIAHYLDTKTAQIDRKIDLLTQKATLYGNLKQSLINETVTRGLDKSVPMKDSGIEWLGEVPEHWNVTTLKTIAQIIDGDRGSEYPNELDFVSTGVPFLSTSNLIDNQLDFSIINFISQEKFSRLRKGKLKNNDLIITVRGTIGSTAIFNNDRFETAFINAQMMIIRPNHRKYSTIFLHYKSLSLFWKQQLDIYAYGTAQKQLNTGIVRNIFIAFPPLSEQKEIANYLDTKTAQIDQIIQTINTQIEKLKELRKTLINDVVTGKIKVV